MRSGETRIRHHINRQMHAHVVRMALMPFNRTLLALLALATLTASAQKVYTDHDYAQAERWMSYNTGGLVKHTVSRPDYLPDGRVFFRDPAPAPRPT